MIPKVKQDPDNGSFLQSLHLRGHTESPAPPPPTQVKAADWQLRAEPLRPGPACPRTHISTAGERWAQETSPASILEKDETRVPLLFFIIFFFISPLRMKNVPSAALLTSSKQREKRQKILLVAAACGILKWREGGGNKEKMAQRIKRIVHNVWFPARFYCERPCRESSWTVAAAICFHRAIGCKELLFVQNAFVHCGSARNYLQWRSQTNVVKVYAQLWNCFGSFNYCQSMPRSRWNVFKVAQRLHKCGLWRQQGAALT